MAKKKHDNRELKRQRLVMKYAQREHFKKQIEETSSLKEKLMLQIIRINVIVHVYDYIIVVL
jgi:hypothetical protein